MTQRNAPLFPLVGGLACLYLTIIVGGAFLFEDAPRILVYLAGASSFSIAWPSMIKVYLDMKADCDDGDLPYFALLSAFAYLHLVSGVAATLCLFRLVPATWFAIPVAANVISEIYCPVVGFLAADARDLPTYMFRGFFVGLIPLFLSIPSLIEAMRDCRMASHDCYHSEGFQPEFTGIFCVAVFAIPAVGCLLYWLCHACRAPGKCKADSTQLSWLCHACRLLRCTLPCQRFYREAPAQTSVKPSGRSMEQNAYEAGCQAGECSLKEKLDHLFEHMRGLREEVSQAHMRVIYEEVNPLKANVDQLFGKICVIEAVLQDFSQYHKRASAEEEERPQSVQECV